MLLLLLLLLLMGLHNLPPARYRDQAVQGHLFAVHVHLMDDWQAVDRNNVVVKVLVVKWMYLSPWYQQRLNEVGTCNKYLLRDLLGDI